MENVNSTMLHFYYVCYHEIGALSRGMGMGFFFFISKYFLTQKLKKNNQKKRISNDDCL